MISVYDGQLEIDHDRGVIYFHRIDNGSTLLRICRLGQIPSDVKNIDITHKVGVSFDPAQPKCHPSKKS